jgi:two-component system response regulator AtoC
MFSVQELSMKPFSMERPTRSVSMSSPSKGRILIVDDDTVFRHSLGKVLAKEGYRIFLAADGEEADRLLGDQPIDVMLVDFKMPHKDGMTVARDALRTAPALKVIMITAFGDLQVQDELQRMGVFAYASKPIRRDDLLSLVRRALGASSPDAL